MKTTALPPSRTFHTCVSRRNRRFMFRDFFVQALALISPSVASAQALECPSIAAVLQERSINNSSTSFLNTVFKERCESNGKAKKTTAGASLEAVVKEIPVKFLGTYSNSEQAINNFCDLYSSSTEFKAQSNSYEEKIARNGLETINLCLTLQAQGVVINHQILSRESTTFWLKSAVDHKIQVTGVYLGGPVTCSGSIAGKPTPIDQSTIVTVDNSQSFSCLRQPFVGKNKVEYYKEATISVATNLGNYNVIWPKDERLPEDSAANINKDLDEVKGTLTKLQNRKSVVDTREVSAGPYETKTITLGKANDYYIWALSGETQYRHGLGAGTIKCDIARTDTDWTFTIIAGDQPVGTGGSTSASCRAIGVRNP